MFNFEIQQYLNFFREKKFKAQNVRSFNTSDTSFRSTRSKLFSLLHGNPDVLFISEVKLGCQASKEKINNFLKFRNYSFFTNSSSFSRGVAIIIKNSMFSNAEIIHCCPQQNSMLIKFTSGQQQLVWQACVAYLDNNDDSEYLFNLISKFDQKFPLFFGGDLNSVLDPEKDPKKNIDLYNRSAIPNPKCSELLAKNLPKLGLIDPFRFSNSDSFDFTYISNGGASRIDHLLVPSFLSNSISAVHFSLSSNNFDHKNVTVVFSGTQKLKKKKILNEILNTRTSNRIIKMGKFCLFFDCLRHILDEPLASNCLKLLSLDFKIKGLECSLLERDDLLLFTLLDQCYREFEICYTECQEIFNLNLKEELEPNGALIILLNYIKNEMLSVSGSIIKARTIRKSVINANLARARSQNDQTLIFQLQKDLDSVNAIEIDLLGKKLPSNDPFWEYNAPKEISNYLNYNSSEKLLLLSRDGNEAEVEKICFNHFKSAFNQNIGVTQDDISNFLGETSTKLKTLSNADKHFLRKSFTKNEILECVSKFKTDKSTGLDGITPGLLKEIVPISIDIFLSCFNENYLNGKQFDKSLKTSYIKLIPKGGKCLSSISNWRPITIISNVNKLYCKLIYNRLEPITDKILEEGQCAYRPSSDLSDVYLNLRMIIDSFAKSGDSACLLSLDFSKAFDSLSHHFIEQILTLYDFPTHFIKAIMGYLKDNLSCIILDSGKLSDFFKLFCGTGQGNPLSALVFILAVNILIIKLNHTGLITPLTQRLYNEENIHRRCGGYADDLGVIINRSAPDLKTLEEILEKFGKISGLNLNKTKTELCPINFTWENDLNFKEATQNAGFKLGGTKIKLLGTVIFLDGKDDTDDNWSSVLKKINLIFLKFSQLNLSILSKTTIVKNFILSNIAFTARTCIPSAHIINQIEEKICNFLGFSPTTQGVFSNSTIFGLEIPNIEQFCQSLLIKNLSRCLKSNALWGRYLLKRFKYNSIDRDTLLSPSTFITNLTDTLSKFCIEYYKALPQKAPVFFSPSMRNLCKNIEIGTNPPPPISEHASETADIIRIKDLVSTPLNKNSIEELLGYRLSFLSYFRLYAATTFIKKSYKLDNRSLNAHNFLRTAKSSKTIRAFLNNKTEITKKNLFDHYTESKNIRVSSNDLLSFLTKQYFPTNFRSFFLSLKLNKLKSRAQMSHFTDTNPNCNTCGASCTLIHLLFECQTTRNIVHLVMSDLLEINNIQYEEIWNGKGIQPTLKKASYIILGACIYTIYNLDRRMKKPNLAAARNSSLLVLKAYAKTRQGEKYIQGVHNTPFFSLIKNLF